MDENGPWCIWVFFFVIPVFIQVNAMVLSWWLRRQNASSDDSHQKKIDSVLLLA
jgi:hypothetical protein